MSEPMSTFHQHRPGSDRAKGSNRADIEGVFARFSQAYQHGDLHAVRGLFLDDARAVFGNLGSFDGPEAIIAGLSAGWAGADVVRHRLTNQYVATSAGTGQQSAYLTGLVADDRDGDLEPGWFGGHYANSYRLTDHGWKIAELRFELDWQAGRHPSMRPWSPPRSTLGWAPEVVLPTTLSALDAPWHVIPHPEETGSDTDQIRDAYTRYAWAVDQWDLGLLKDILTDDVVTKFCLLPLRNAALVLQRQIVMSSFVVAGTGTGLADPSPYRPVPDVGEGVPDRIGDSVEQPPDLVDGQRNQDAFSTGIRAPFLAPRRRIVRNAAAVIDNVMCRYHAV